MTIPTAEKHLTGYEKIKAMAKERGCPITDLIVLARQNDPFFVGTEANIRDGEWFHDQWQRLDYVGRTGIHLRRIHYKLVSQEEPVAMPNGKPYENTDACWNYLSISSKYARYLGYVDPTAFDDRRNGKPMEFYAPVESRPGVYVSGGEVGMSLNLPPLPGLPEYEIDGFNAAQRYLLEIWCEKSTMNDVLVPLCRRYGMNLVTGLGELSATSCLWLVERVKRLDMPCRIFYISDFDPAGQSMPVAVARKIEKFVEDYGTPEMDIKLIPIALSHEQCIEYKLPRTPIKETERRATGFEQRFGTGATELDALESLHPGELRKVIQGWVLKYYDEDLDDMVAYAEVRIQAHLNKVRDEVLQPHLDAISEVRTRFSELAQEYNAKAQALGSEIRSVWQAIQHDLERNMPDVSKYDLPEPEPATEDVEPLFDSLRPYDEQLDIYKAFQGKQGGSSHGKEN